MAGEWTPVDIGDDTRGSRWGIGTSGDRVVIVTAGSLHFDAEGRDRFAKAWAEAERQAEAQQGSLCGSCVPYGACQGADSIERCPAPEAERQAEAVPDGH